jgi:hypothetical protein
MFCLLGSMLALSVRFCNKFRCIEINNNKIYDFLYKIALFYSQ